jgi:hypothetical protein
VLRATTRKRQTRPLVLLVGTGFHNVEERRHEMAKNNERRPYGIGVEAVSVAGTGRR